MAAGSVWVLNYYSRFVEDFAIYASILYELREIDFFETSGQAKARLESDDQKQRDKWTRATKAFVLLKDKIVHAPIMPHFNPDKRPVVILYASKSAISAALVQEHEGVYKPVTFTSRTLKPNEINYGIVHKEVLALLRVLDVCYTQLVTRSIKVLTRHSTLAWMLNSSGLDYEIDEVGLFFYCPSSKQSYEDRDLVTGLVIPETLQEDVLHHYHISLEGGHQGIGRTYQRIRAHFHWRGLYRSVQ
ncbi:unnamed protein product [Phytophthora fragariaefolia]|uniref:Unnamed protein product n=1 Tax=Phytophthora fragariaefolia TaxID=1490495 RepID=A0A9W6Y0Q7_9STRA|nr:unnamed protein product [Phytophthora fragariaefolia]